jgi:hypothetical protein
MGNPVRVITTKPWEKMDTPSRINFAKIYTFEHNVKVNDFGFIDPQDESKLPPGGRVPMVPGSPSDSQYTA